MILASTMTIDIETYSSRDLAKCGVYAYTQAEDFEILLFGYAFDDEEVKVVDLKNGEELPKEVKAALVDPSILKVSYNANFERTCIAAHFKLYMPPEHWRCTMIQALELGLPSSLEGVAKSLRLPQQKLSEGKALIKYFSMPCAETEANGFRKRNLPEHDRNKYEIFKSYCKRDVEVERDIRRKLSDYEITDAEQRLWCFDQRANDEGVSLSPQLVKQALICSQRHKESLQQEALQLTGIQNPNSAAQMKKWLQEVGNIHIESLSKENVTDLLKKVSDKKIRRVLQLRQELSKTSIMKYEAMDKAMCTDNKIRGLFKFYGANRTGRWSGGSAVMAHNLPQTKLQDLDMARNLLMEGHYEALDMLFDSVPEVLSQLIRTVFIPSENSRFIIADFSAIEARVIAYYAVEKWRIEVFKAHGKIYEASAAQMFKVPIDTVTKDSPLRQKAKVSELALGYQGGTGALTAMGALQLGLKEEELPGLVSAWRNSNPNIVKLWGDVERAAIAAVRDNRIVTIQQGIQFSTEGGIFFITLPSGRRLAYVRPSIEIDGRYNKPMITYEGVEQGTKKWGRIQAYGGKFVENITQAIARDCLAMAMLRLDEAGYKIVMHCHDEVVLDVPNGFGSLEEVQDIMARPIEWAKGLPLRADAFESNYYKK